MADKKKSAQRQTGDVITSTKLNNSASIDELIEFS